MTVDVASALVFLALTYLGWRAGLLSQAIRVGAVFAVMFAGPFVAALIRHAIFGESEVAAPFVEGFCLFLAGILIYAAISLAGWLGIKTMRAASDTLSTTDRVGGALVGTLKAAVIIYLLIFVALFFEAGLKKHDPDDRLRMRDGHTTAFVKAHNVLAPWHLPDLVRVSRMIRVHHWAKEGSKLGIIRDNPRAADVLRKSTIKPLLADKTLTDAAISDDYITLLADPRIRELMKDKDSLDEISRVDWEEIEKKVAPEPPKTESKK